MSWKQVHIIFAALVGSACGTQSLPFGQLNSVQSGSMFVAMNAPASAGTGVVALLNPDGSFERILKDYNTTSETPFGLVYDSDSLYIGVRGSDRIDRVDLTDFTVNPFIVNSNMTAGTLHGLAYGSGHFFTVEFSATAANNMVEKWTMQGVRQGAPYIANAVAPCTLNVASSARKVALLPSGSIVVTNSATPAVNIYGPSGTTCAAVSGASLAGCTGPQGVVYDAFSQKIIVACNTNSRLLALNADGTGGTIIYNDTGSVSGPSDIASDGNGYLYVTNVTLNTVEKLSYSGGATATRVGSTPLVPSSYYMRAPTAIAVKP